MLCNGMTKVWGIFFLVFTKRGGDISSKYTLSVIFFPGKGGCVVQATSEICKLRITTSSEMSSVPFGILLPKHNVIYHIISITTLQHAACRSPIIMGCGFSCVCPAVFSQVFLVHAKKDFAESQYSSACKCQDTTPHFYTVFILDLLKQFARF